jgi:hypothetical protein
VPEFPQYAQPADKGFIGSDKADSVEECSHFLDAQACLLFALPARESVLDYRDRTMLKTLALYRRLHRHAAAP